MNLSDLYKQIADKFNEWLEIQGGFSVLIKRHALKVAVFVLLCLIFFALKYFSLSFSRNIGDLLTQNKINSSYASAEISYFPPRVNFTKLSLAVDNNPNSQVNFDDLQISLKLLPLLKAAVGIEVQGKAGRGSLELDLSTGALLNFDLTKINLQTMQLPLTISQAVRNYDSQARIELNLQAKGTLRWQDLANYVAQELDMQVSGDLKIAELKNGITLFTLDKIQAGSLVFAANIQGRTLELSQANFVMPSLSSEFSGKVALDYRNIVNSEFNILAKLKAQPDILQNWLINQAIADHIASGQSLDFSIQGTLFSTQVLPLF